MEQQCVICHDRPAAFRCIRCHKPVCDECAFKDENGAFCARECAAEYRSFKQADARGAAARGSGSLLKVIIVLILLALVAGGVFVYGAKKGWFGEETKRKVIEKQKEIQEKIKK